LDLHRLVTQDPDLNEATQGKDLSYATITIADEKKRLVPGSMNRLKFNISGGEESQKNQA
jgi:hypothetical protein